MALVSSHCLTRDTYLAFRFFSCIFATGPRQHRQLSSSSGWRCPFVLGRKSSTHRQSVERGGLGAERSEKGSAAGSLGVETGRSEGLGWAAGSAETCGPGLGPRARPLATGTGGVAPGAAGGAFLTRSPCGEVLKRRGKAAVTASRDDCSTQCGPKSHSPPTPCFLYMLLINKLQSRT